MKNLKVALFNDHTLLSEGIKQILINELEINNIVKFTSVSELINLSVDLVIIYDYAIQFRSLPTDFKLNNKTTPLLFLTNSDQEVVALREQNLTSLHTLSVDCKKEEFLSKLIEITQQESNGIRRKSPKGQKISAHVNRLTSTFSPREREVIKLAMSGLQSKQIGRILEISPRTVDKHRANSMQKCNAKNIVELISHIQTKNIEL
jgi:DNA-binding NarL/FixJ family response regulator